MSPHFNILQASMCFSVSELNNERMGSLLFTIDHQLTHDNCMVGSFAQTSCKEAKLAQNGLG